MKSKTTVAVKNCLIVFLLLVAGLLAAVPTEQQVYASTEKVDLGRPALLQADPPNTHPIMRITAEQKRAEGELTKGMSAAPIDRAIQRKLQGRTEGAALSLLSHIQYTPAQRSQGSTGNCWVWAGTGVLEVALDVQRSIKDRLSIQYFDSNYTPWAGCGGTANSFSNFYASKLKVIPWLNTNAFYQDGSRSCESGGSLVAPGSIGQTPSYAITSIGPVQLIPTYGVGQATAIANIKNILDQNKAVYFAFYLANDTDWDQFFSFWRDQAESVIWNGAHGGFSCGEVYDSDGHGGGHAVVCVGYDDSAAGTDNDYWIMLNSWGANTGRPNGLFRIPMYYDYDCADSTGGPNTAWESIPVTFAAQTQLRLIGAGTDYTLTGKDSRFWCNPFVASKSGNVTEIRCRSSDTSGHYKAAIYADNAGAPDALIQANNVEVNSVNGWAVLTLSTPAPVVSGTTYWLAMASDANTSIYYVAGGTRKGKAITFSTFTFPDPAGTGFDTDSYTHAIEGWGTPPVLTITTTSLPGGTQGTDYSQALQASGGSTPYTWSVLAGSLPAGLLPINSSTGIISGTPTVAGTSTFTVQVTDAVMATDTQSLSITIGTPAPVGDGEKLIGAGTDYTLTGKDSRFWCNPFVASKSGNVTEIRCRSSDTSGHYKAAIYADNAGAPGALIQANNVEVNAVNGWAVLTLSTPAPVVSGTTYWLAMASDATTSIYYVAGGTRKGKAITFSTFAFPDPAGTGFDTDSYTHAIEGWSGTVAPVAPAAPTRDCSALTFKWYTAMGATKYHLQVNTSLGFTGTDKLNAEVGNVLSREVIGLTAGTTYYWRVKAGNTAGWSDWSTTGNTTCN